MRRKLGGPLKSLGSSASQSKMPASSLSEGLRIAEDLVQSLVLPANMLEMREADLEFYRCRAFQSILQV